MKMYIRATYLTECHTQHCRPNLKGRLWKLPDFDRETGARHHGSENPVHVRDPVTCCSVESALISLSRRRYTRKARQWFTTLARLIQQAL
jgi:hypothetical protein